MHGKSKDLDVNTTGSRIAEDKEHDDVVQTEPFSSGSPAARVVESCDTADGGLQREQLGDGKEDVSDAETMDEPVFPVFIGSPRRASRDSEAS